MRTKHYVTKAIQVNKEKGKQMEMGHNFDLRIPSSFRYRDSSLHAPICQDFIRESHKSSKSTFVK